jgi:uncharacterized repeat protein (TIGR01451 family)
LAVAAGLGSAFQFQGQARAQAAPPATAPALPLPNPTVVPAPAPVPSPAPAPAPAAQPATAVVGPGAAVEAPGAPVLPADVQVVRFQGPEGLIVDVIGPGPEPAPAGDGHGITTLGLRVGVPYRLRVSNIPERPGVALFPVIEVVGHLHRPQGIDPGKYPIRVVFSLEDLYDTVDRGRLVTQVVYLEDPDQALPVAMPKDEIPVVSLGPAEDPLKVASALGRVMAIVRMGGRQPSPDEPPFGVVGPGAGGPCPFIGPDGGRCPVACGPVCGTPPPPGRPWLPRDEFLCDGGDRATPAHFAGDGGLTGIDPRDAVVRFDDGRRPRALPTNVVCIYAPRFAEVRTSLGTTEALAVEGATTNKLVEKQATEAARQGPKRLAQNTAAELARVRARASGLASRTRAGGHTEVRVLNEYNNSVNIALNRLRQVPETARNRQKAAKMLERLRAEGIKTAESAVVTGIIEGASQTVMTWTPRETVGVETPPNRPGMAVVKRVSAGEAEAGDVLTFVIQYRNMGNTPIRSVAIVDSLLPRLGYVPGSAKGPTGTVFTAGENSVGSTELRWEIPGAIPPGGEGYVEFQAVVR